MNNKNTQQEKTCKCSLIGPDYTCNEGCLRSRALTHRIAHNLINGFYRLPDAEQTYNWMQFDQEFHDYYDHAQVQVQQDPTYLLIEKLNLVRTVSTSTALNIVINRIRAGDHGRILEHFLQERLRVLIELLEEYTDAWRGYKAALGIVQAHTARYTCKHAQVQVRVTKSTYDSYIVVRAVDPGDIDDGSVPKVVIDQKSEGLDLDEVTLECVACGATASEHYPTKSEGAAISMLEALTVTSVLEAYIAMRFSDPSEQF